MATGAIIGHGTTLEYDQAGGGGAAVTVGEVFDISGPNQEAGQVEATNFDSPDAYREFIAGLKDGGDIEVQLNYKKATMTNLAALLGVLKEWTITLPDGSTWVSDAVMTALGQATPVGDRVVIPFTLHCSEKPTFTAA